MYGVTAKTFWKMVQVVPNAKQGSQGINRYIANSRTPDKKPRKGNLTQE